jgi:hypothetical protein
MIIIIPNYAGLARTRLNDDDATALLLIATAWTMTLRLRDCGSTGKDEDAAAALHNLSWPVDDCRR